MNLESNVSDSNHEQGESRSSTVILFLSFSVLAACISKIIFSKFLRNKIPLPFTVAVLLLGFIIGIIVTQIKTVDNDFLFGEIQLSSIDPHLLYYIFLPLLIFDSAFNGHFHVIKQQLFSAILMAGPGVFISTVIIALCGIYMFPYGWSWPIGLMFGSILSATDPIAIVALLHDSGASKSLASLIDSESLLNDGSAFVIFLIFQNIVTGRDNDAKSIIISIVKFSICGPLFGLACGIISVIVLNRINNELEVEITFTFGLAYLIFYIADAELGVSAVLALVTMGLYMSKYKYCISSTVQPAMASAWRIATYFINILIFTITGIILAKSFIGTATSIAAKDFGFSIVLYVIIHVGRVLTIVILYPLIKCTGVHLSWKECVILAWSGLRGSMALILVLIVSLDTKIDRVTRDRFLFHVSVIVLLTLIINGTSSKFLVKALRLHHGTKESEIVLSQALEHMRRQTSWKLAQMKQDEKFADVDWKMLNEYLPDKLLEELDEENDTHIHQQLSTAVDPNPPQTFDSRTNPEPELRTVPPVYQVDSRPTSPMARTHPSDEVDTALPVVDIRSANDEYNTNIRNELIMRFLTAMSIDYEKQWYLGMIRRQTLNILIKSVEQAKQKCSLQLHWELIVEHFRLPIFIRLLMKCQYFKVSNRWTDRLLFDHLFRTIELTLSFHSAKTRLDNIRLQFPELANLSDRIMNEVCDEVRMYQSDALHILLDLQQSYPLCWSVQMTRRCAQMLLKYESIAIIQLYETGMLEQHEYAHILELIENKLFTLEYGGVRMFQKQKKTLEHPFSLMPYFRSLPHIDQVKWKWALKPERKWFQPGAVLLQRDQRVSTAYLIVRGIVQCKADATPTYYKCGSIIGVDALFAKKSLYHGIYTASGGLVEAYAISASLLSMLLTDEKISRSIYNEIALHMIMNNTPKSLDLTHSQLQMLLSGKALFHKNQSSLSLHLEANDRVFLLSGTMTRCSDAQETLIDCGHVLLLDCQVTFELNSSSIVYIWTREDEVYCSNVKRFKITFSDENNPANYVEPFYPLYLGESIEFTPRRFSSSMTRPIENTGNFQMIPAEIEVSNELRTPMEFV